MFSLTLGYPQTRVSTTYIKIYSIYASEVQRNLLLLTHLDTQLYVKIYSIYAWEVQRNTLLLTCLDTQLYIKIYSIYVWEVQRNL